MDSKPSVMDSNGFPSVKLRLMSPRLRESHAARIRAIPAPAEGKAEEKAEGKGSLAWRRTKRRKRWRPRVSPTQRR